MLMHADESTGKGRKFLIHVDQTLGELLSREDTDENWQITIDDLGPKVGSPVDLFKRESDV